MYIYLFFLIKFIIIKILLGIAEAIRRICGKWIKIIKEFLKFKKKKTRRFYINFIIK